MNKSKEKKMDLRNQCDIPIGKTICLTGYNGKNIQNQGDTGKAFCCNENTESWEQMILSEKDNKFVIQSTRDGRNLQVQSSGDCVFADHDQLLSETFDVEINAEDGKLYFISCNSGNVLQLCSDGYVRAIHSDRLSEGGWKITVLANEGNSTSNSLKTIAICSAVGLLAVPAAGMAAGALVPFAMSYFGTVVAGVGTIHAPLAAGGVAAILQSTSVVLATSTASAAGLVVGGVAGTGISVIREGK